MPRQRLHNEHFRSVSLGGRKSCPNCKCKLEPGEKIWSWGEYRYAKWRTVMHFCKKCFVTDVQRPLNDHTDGCGCTVVLNVRLDFHETRPAWLKLDEVCPAKVAA